MIPATSIAMNLHSITSMMMKPIKKKSIRIQQDFQSVLLWKDIMPLSLPMGRLEQGRPIQCKVSNTISPVKKEALFQEPSKISLHIQKSALIRKKYILVYLGHLYGSCFIHSNL